MDRRGHARAAAARPPRIGAGQARTVAASRSLTDGLAALPAAPTASESGPVRICDRGARCRRDVAVASADPGRLVAGGGRRPGAGARRAGSSSTTSTPGSPRSRATAASRRRSCWVGSRPRGRASSRRAPSRSWRDAARRLDLGRVIEPARPSGPAELALGLRVAWARRVQETAPEASDWVAGAGRPARGPRAVRGSEPSTRDQLRRLPGIGERGAGARSLRRASACAAARAAWALGDGERADRALAGGAGAGGSRVELDAPVLLRARGRRGGRARSRRVAGRRRAAHGARALGRRRTV